MKLNAVIVCRLKFWRCSNVAGVSCFLTLCLSFVITGGDREKWAHHSAGAGEIGSDQAAVWSSSSQCSRQQRSWLYLHLITITREICSNHNRVLLNTTLHNELCLNMITITPEINTTPHYTLKPLRQRLQNFQRNLNKQQFNLWYQHTIHGGATSWLYYFTLNWPEKAWSQSAKTKYLRWAEE